jgi:hypothetical protein
LHAGGIDCGLIRVDERSVGRGLCAHLLGLLASDHALLLKRGVALCLGARVCRLRLVLAHGAQRLFEIGLERPLVQRK